MNIQTLGHFILSLALSHALFFNTENFLSWQSLILPLYLYINIVHINHLVDVKLANIFMCPLC